MIDPTELQALLDAATPGPWDAVCDECHFGSRTNVEGGGAASNAGLSREIMVSVGGYADLAASEASTQLIALAPTLAASYLEVCAERDALREALNTIATGYNAAGEKEVFFADIARAALHPSKEADDAS